MAVKNARAILSLFVRVNSVPGNIRAVPAENVHRNFIIALAKNAHLKGITATVKNVSINMTINPVKTAASIADRLLYFLTALFNASIKRRILRKKRIKPINE